MKVIASTFLLLRAAASATKNEDRGLLRGSKDEFKIHAMDAKTKDTNVKFAEIARAYEATVMDVTEELNVDKAKFDAIFDALEGLVDETKDEWMVDGKFDATIDTASDCYTSGRACLLDGDCCSGSCTQYFTGFPPVSKRACR